MARQCGNYRGVLGEDIFSSGATKNVHEVRVLLNVHYIHSLEQLSIGSDRFVAKRFFEIGSPEEITWSENKRYLEDELVRLKMAHWFFEKFKSAAKEVNVEFCSGNIFPIPTQS